MALDMAPDPALLDSGAEEPDDDMDDAEDGLALTDADFLAYCKDEKARSVGLDLASELIADRTRSLEYFKGDMDADLPVPEGRSGAISMDVQDTINMILPDLVDIFINEDVATFQPMSQSDEDQAQQESDYVQHVLFDENEGFVILYTMIHDALLTKTGLVTWDWETCAGEDEEHANLNVIAATQKLAELQGSGQEMPELKAEEDGPDGSKRFSLTIPGVEDGRLIVQAFAPEDFSVSEDTVTLRTAPYATRRERARIQDLIASGLDADKVRNLPAYSRSRNDAEAVARDTAGEHSRGDNAGGLEDLRQVEVFHHYLRVDADDSGEPQLWKVTTGNDEATLLKKERVGTINVAAITPYLIPHRFYGLSVADLLLELQRIKTTLTRGYLDSVYFGLNQRYEIATGSGQSNEFTLGDLLNNQPGWPVRSKSGNAVRALGGAEKFNGMEALEYFATQIEQRTGATRMAQGLNPDTLHDTAGGALALLGVAKRRIRLMARIMAETGIKDLFLGMHATLRANQKKPKTVKLRSKWAEGVLPSTWPERTSMKVKIGLGASGRDHDMAFINQVIGLQEKIVATQGGVDGPFVTARNVSNALQRLGTLGQVDPNAFFSEPDPNAAPAQPQPDPKLDLEAQKLKIEQGKLDLKSRELAMQEQKQAAELERQQEEGAFNQRLELAKLEQERDLAIAEIDAKYKTQTDTARIRAEAEGLRVGADLAITAASHEHKSAVIEAEQTHAHDVLARQHDHEHESAARDHLLSLHGAEHAATIQPAADEPDPAGPPDDETLEEPQ